MWHLVLASHFNCVKTFWNSLFPQSWWKVHFQLTFSNGRELQGRENEAPKNTVGNSLEERKSPLLLNSFHHSSFAYQCLFLCVCVCEILVPLPGEFHGLRSLVGYSSWGREESHTTEQLTRFLVSWTRIESGAMAVKALCPNHWSVRDLPSLSFS